MMTTSRNKRTVKTVIAFFVAAIMLLAGVLLFRYFQNTEEPDLLETNVKASLGQLEGKSNEEIQEALNRVVEEGYMSISINANPTFANGEAAGTLRIENSPANTCLQEVTITRNDTGDVLYRSGLIEPNYHIQEDKLLEDLDAGQYECTALFTAYDVNQTVIGSANAQITISVLG